MDHNETVQRIITTRRRIMILLQRLSKSGVDFKGDLVNSTEKQLEEILKHDQNILTVLNEMQTK